MIEDNNLELDNDQSNDLLGKIAKTDYKKAQILLERGNRIYKKLNIEEKELGDL